MNSEHENADEGNAGREAEGTVHPLGFSTYLSGDKEKPAPSVATTATGDAVFEVSEDETAIVFEVRVTCLRDVTRAHVHLGAADEIGPPVVELWPGDGESGRKAGPLTGILASGRITADDLVGPLEGADVATLVEEMLDGRTYVNVHTEQYPAGEIRGRIAHPFEKADPTEADGKGLRTDERGGETEIDGDPEGQGPT